MKGKNNMARAKKDGKFFNCYIDKEIFEKLEQYCEKTSIPKTSVVEKALSQYLKTKEDEIGDMHLTAGNRN